MNGNRYLLDSNAVLYLLNQNLKVNPDSDLYISFITELELLSYKYLSQEDEQVIKQFFKKIKIINIDNDIKQKTINIRKTYNMKLPDSIITATALVNNLIFITNDKDLFKIKEISIKNLDFLFKN